MQDKSTNQDVDYYIYKISQKMQIEPALVRVIIKGYLKYLLWCIKKLDFRANNFYFNLGMEFNRTVRLTKREMRNMDKLKEQKEIYSKQLRYDFVKKTNNKFKKKF